MRSKFRQYKIFGSKILYKCQHDSILHYLPLSWQPIHIHHFCWKHLLCSCDLKKNSVEPVMIHCTPNIPSMEHSSLVHLLFGFLFNWTIIPNGESGFIVIESSVNVCISRFFLFTFACCNKLIKITWDESKSHCFLGKRSLMTARIAIKCLFMVFITCFAQCNFDCMVVHLQLDLFPYCLLEISQSFVI